MTPIQAWSSYVRTELPEEGGRAVATRCEMREVADGCLRLRNHAERGSNGILEALVDIVDAYWLHPMSEAKLKMIWAEVQRPQRSMTAMVIAEDLE